MSQNKKKQEKPKENTKDKSSVSPTKKVRQIEITELDDITHTLQRPDSYAGSILKYQDKKYVGTKTGDDYNIIKKDIESNDGLLRIFIEAISNAIDNKWRSDVYDTPMTKIKIDIDQKTAEITVWNDGTVIACVKDENGVYAPEKAFGQFKTSSNYNDNEERLTSGRNGIGAFLILIFSKYARVTINDPVNKILYQQEWRNNAYDKSPPKITPSKLKTGYTEVKWIPDLKRFGYNEDSYTDDMMSLYLRYILETAMLSKLPVYYNDEKILIKSFQDYVKLYVQSKIEEIEDDEIEEDTGEKIKEEGEECEDNEVKKQVKEEFLLLKSGGCEVILIPSEDNMFESFSFVNGINTYKGGLHVDEWRETIFRPLVEKINKGGGSKTTPEKGKKAKDKIIKSIIQVDKYFKMFINCVIDKPAFKGQYKEEFVGPKIETKIETKHINTLMKWDFVNKINDIIYEKELSNLNSNKKSKILIDEYIKANNAGTKQSSECFLILTEGLSAKAYVKAGIDKGMYGKSGYDYFGILPLKGKLLNVRKSSIKQIIKNAIVQYIIVALNLQHGLDYTIESNFKTLNYGTLVMYCDCDLDGFHIEGLVINMIQKLYTSLLYIKRDRPFCIGGKTPICRIKMAKDELVFYDETRCKKYIKEQTKKLTNKYYKGLGTIRNEEVDDTFGEKMIEYIPDDKTLDTVNLVFGGDLSNKRKVWINEYNPELYTSLDDCDKIHQMTISDFLNSQVIQHSIGNCKRTLASMIDGLKESQRKILFAAKKRKLKYTSESLKIAQLAAYTSEHTLYHHGEKSLSEAIFKLTNEFVGSNNIPLLYRDGQTGSRSHGGDDHASERYTYTKLDILTQLIFREEDEELLQNNNEDGIEVEYEYYVPILPMVLINGCKSIATGWASTIPCYNPIDCINYIKQWLNSKNNDTTDKIEVGEEKIRFQPWYRGFTGKIEEQYDSKKNQTYYKSYGRFEKDEDDNVIIDELPIGLWIDDYYKILQQFEMDKKISKVKYKSKPNKPLFHFKEIEDGMICNDKNLKLIKNLNISNMVLFNIDGKIKKYKDVYEIINEFCAIRLEFYVKRKKHILKKLRYELSVIVNKIRFITEVKDKKLIIMNRKEDEVIENLVKSEYLKISDSYDYLLHLQIRTFTAEKINKLNSEKTELETKLKEIENTTEEQMWINELDEFLIEYEKWLVVMDKLDNAIYSKKEKKNKGEKKENKKVNKKK